VTIIRNKVTEKETLFNVLRQKRLRPSTAQRQRDLYVGRLCHCFVNKESDELTRLR